MSFLDDPSADLSARRTGMSFQRTRMSADRTLMSVMRTAIAMIGFGFAVSQFFDRMELSGTIAVGSQGLRNFGAALVWLGIALLTMGIVFHTRFMGELRHERRVMKAEGLLHTESGFPVSLTVVTAWVLLVLGLGVALSLVFPGRTVRLKE
jgi:putative membrane protein